MTITITIPNEYGPGLQRLATLGGHADIPALCYAPIVELAKTGLEKVKVEDEALFLKKKAAYDKADAKATKEQIEAAVAADIEAAKG